METKKRVARRGDWQTIPFPDVCHSVPLDRIYTPAEFSQIAAGRIPEEMEDKWFIFFEEPWLYLHRSWTGFSVFKVRFESAFGGSRVAEAWASPGSFHPQPGEQLPTEERQAVFNSLLLGALLDGQAGRDAEAAWDRYFDALRVGTSITVADQGFGPALLAFYGEDDGPAANGYTREQLLGWSDDDWEHEHDFIQWLFPTDTPSMYNPDAPVLDEEMAATFRADPLRRHRLRQSFDRWLTFCGVGRTDSGLAFVRARPSVWARQNHNWLRVTRVLRSLRLLGLPDEAAEFFALLQTIRPQVDAGTWAYWQAAAGS